MELLLKHGARVDVEARMCWPGPHQHNCEERGRHSRSRVTQSYASSDKLQCAIYYAIDGDQVSSQHQLGLGLSFLRRFCFDFIDGAVISSSLRVNMRSTNLTQTASWDRAIYEIKINLA